jgi:hypothetical protein
MMSLRILLTASLLPVAVGSALGCSSQESTPTAAPTSAQLSTTGTSDTYSLPTCLADSPFEIYVDGTLWRKVETLSDFGPDDQVYVVTRNSDGSTSIRFGDGEHGSRLPSRSSKVVATYSLARDAGSDSSVP